MTNRTRIASKAFQDGFNCAQAVLLSFARDLDSQEGDLLKLASGFGAGMARRQETCGAVSGGVMAIGDQLAMMISTGFSKGVRIMFGKTGALVGLALFSLSGCLDSASQSPGEPAPFHKRFVFFNNKDSVIETVTYAIRKSGKDDTLYHAEILPQHATDTLPYESADDTRFYWDQRPVRSDYEWSPFEPQGELCGEVPMPATHEDSLKAGKLVLLATDPEVTVAYVSRASCYMIICDQGENCSEVFGKLKALKH